MNKEAIWAMYFSGICSFKFHPRNEVRDTTAAIQQAATLADDMLREHELRWPDVKEERWAG